MKVFVHSAAHPASRIEIDTYPLVFSVMQSRFYMELSPPYIIYADHSYMPTHLEFAQNGFHVSFAEEAIASGFVAWLKKANQDAREYFCNMPD